jgi:hypothetical protein
MIEGMLSGLTDVVTELVRGLCRFSSIDASGGHLEGVRVGRYMMNLRVS